MPENMAFITSLSQFITSGISYRRYDDPQQRCYDDDITTATGSPYILSSSPPDSTMELYVLEHRLHFLSVPKDKIHLLTHAVIKVALLPQSRPSFFSFTETDEDYSLIISHEDYQAFPEVSSVITSEYLWRVITVTPGAMGASSALIGIGKIAKSVISPLADNKIPILCLSTYQSDFILVKECDLGDATKCLGRFFKIYNEDHKRVNDTKVLSTSPEVSSDRVRPIVHPFHGSHAPYHITGLDEAKLQANVQTLLDLMFYQGSGTTEDGEAFFHFSIVHSDISLIINNTAMNKFPSNTLQTRMNSGLGWQKISIGENLDFEECGIVAQVVEPIAKHVLATYYVSTFYQDHCLVVENELTQVIEILDAKRMENIAKEQSSHVDATSAVDELAASTDSPRPRTESSTDLPPISIPSSIQTSTGDKSAGDLSGGSCCSSESIQFLVSPDSDCSSPLLTTPSRPLLRGGGGGVGGDSEATLRLNTFGDGKSLEQALNELDM